MRNSKSIEARNQHGFTLIELSIVLVIIGLIVGGILTGQSLIKQAQIRSTLTLLTRLDTATNTFKDKFNALPGDMTNYASVGLSVPSLTACLGDNLVEALNTGGCNTAGAVADVYAGEVAVFFAQLYQAQILQDFYNKTMAITGTGLTSGVPTAAVTTSSMPTYLLQAAYSAGGKAFYIWVMSGNMTLGTGLPTTITSHNYYRLGNITAITTGGAMTDGLAVTATDASGIDSKLDDGVPNTGTVLANDSTAGDMAIAGTACTATGATYNIASSATVGACGISIQAGF